MTCLKCRGLVVVHNDEARCLNCGRYYFPPDSTVEICSQGGTCTEKSERDGLCEAHWRMRMGIVNDGRPLSRRYRA